MVGSVFFYAYFSGMLFCLFLYAYLLFFLPSCDQTICNLVFTPNLMKSVFFGIIKNCNMSVLQN